MNDDFWPTPPHLVKKLLSLVDICPGMDVLEPHAGRANIAREIRNCFPEANLRVVEKDPKLAHYLKGNGFHGVNGDFFKYWTPADVIVGNPPFRHNFVDIDHFRHAWEILRPGGQIAFILHEYSAYPKFTSGKPFNFVQFLRLNGLRSEMNPPRSFSNAERRTNTGTCVVWGSKPIPVSFDAFGRFSQEVTHGSYRTSSV